MKPATSSQRARRMAGWLLCHGTLVLSATATRPSAAQYIQYYNYNDSRGQNGGYVRTGPGAPVVGAYGTYALPDPYGYYSSEAEARPPIRDYARPSEAYVPPTEKPSTTWSRSRTVTIIGPQSYIDSLSKRGETATAATAGASGGRIMTNAETAAARGYQPAASYSYNNNAAVGAAILSGLRTERHGIVVEDADANPPDEDVRRAQEALNRLGLGAGRPDGLLGPQTLLALKSFQRSRGIHEDEAFGPLTRQALLSASSQVERMGSPPPDPIVAGNSNRVVQDEAKADEDAAAAKSKTVASAPVKSAPDAANAVAEPARNGSTEQRSVAAAPASSNIPVVNLDEEAQKAESAALAAAAKSKTAPAIASVPAATAAKEPTFANDDVTPATNLPPPKSY